MALWSLLTKVPWKEVLRYAPQIIDRTERLAEFIRASRARRVDPEGAGPDAAAAELLVAEEPSRRLPRPALSFVPDISSHWWTPSARREKIPGHDSFFPADPFS